MATTARIRRRERQQAAARLTEDDVMRGNVSRLRSNIRAHRNKTQQFVDMWSSTLWRGGVGMFLLGLYEAHQAHGRGDEWATGFHALQAVIAGAVAQYIGAAHPPRWLLALLVVLCAASLWFWHAGVMQLDTSNWPYADLFAVCCLGAKALMASLTRQATGNVRTADQVLPEDKFTQ